MPFDDPAVIVPKPRSPGRRYKLADGTRVPSVTQVLQVVAKPALIQWANRMGLQGIDSDAYRDEKAVIGTTAHAMVEHYFRGVVADIPEELREPALPGFRNFLRWRNDHEVEPILIEQSLVSEKHRYGGTVDLVAGIDGTTELIDLKFTKSIHRDQFFQLAAYAALLTENGQPVQRVRIVRLEREPGGRRPFEERSLEVTGEIGPYWQTFKAALALWRAQDHFNKRSSHRVTGEITPPNATGKE